MSKDSRVIQNQDGSTTVILMEDGEVSAILSTDKLKAESVAKAWKSGESQLLTEVG